MLKLNRKTEYALLALQYMSHREGESGGLSNTREIASAYQIPYALLAKIMQTLAARGLIKSVHGTKGGYTLAKRADDIPVSSVVEVFDGRVAVADCFKDAKITCPQWNDCSIKDPLAELNEKIYALLSHTSLRDLSGEEDRKLWETEAEKLPVYQVT